MSNIYVAHSGVKDMKWGLRRYQDEHGNWTELGLERRRAYEKKAREKGTRSTEGMENDEAFRYIIRDDARQVTDAASNAANAARNATDAIKRRLARKRTSRDPSQMSDQELREAINRMQMERTYRELTSKPSTVEKGLDTVGEYLAIIGGVASTAASIAFLMNQF